MQNISLFHDSPDIIPVSFKKNSSITEFIQNLGGTCFEARNVYRGAELFKRMVNDDDVIWLGIAGAGIAGGMGGLVNTLLESGFIDVICSTGAQTYHDLHFAFGLPVKSISPNWDDDLLRQHGDTRIYDIGIRERETLEAQDEIIRRFIRESWDLLFQQTLSSWEFNYQLGLWVQKNARFPERSFVATAAKLGVPVFWDSLSNHSIAMNLTRTDREGFPIILSGQRDVFDSASITFSANATGFVELGGGGPKNFIQQTGPTISQILSIEFEGADRGLQIGTAVERDGSLSGCTFGEAVTWGKYRNADEQKLVQIWGEYSVLFPLIALYVLELCNTRPYKKLVLKMPSFIKKLESAR
ncbi:deoxyhypusine synthase family protein [candidate division KSB1 bacterium]|nr:deoxyhypusine synthase family protein [candidate division KSB1 bacterium]